MSLWIMVQINLPTAGMDFHAAFSGKKASSYGPPEKGGYAREFFTAAKVVHEARGCPAPKLCTIFQ